MQLSKKLLATLMLSGMAISGVALAGWWNEEWKSRKEVVIDTSVTGADLHEGFADVPVLVRLHTGNFGFFAEVAEDGKDLRFALENKTGLKYHIEKFDAVNEMALAWVRMPQLLADTATNQAWMYYGNSSAVDGQEAAATYDTPQSLVYHYREGEEAPQDATAYANHAAASSATVDASGFIGAAAKFDNGNGIRVAASPALELKATDGWTFSTWIRMDQAQTRASVLKAGNVELVIQGDQLSLKSASGASTAAVPLKLATWQAVSVIAQKDSVELYVDGNAAGKAANVFAEGQSDIILGSGFSGWMDETGFARTVRSADWIKFGVRNQSPDFTVVNLGQDESNSAGEGSYIGVILGTVTLDGWVVIAACGVMAVVSWFIMTAKTILVRRATRANREFLEQYRSLDMSGMDAINRDEDPSAEDADIQDSPVLMALFGKKDMYNDSPLYHVYHAAIQEIHRRGQGITTLTPAAINIIKVYMDGALVREMQKLNQSMVILTICIAGGPFLGLLGTVVGVMITFAAIAATGDVNINSIAPGIAAALAATVAGLLVAIPALFGYNYLGSVIKDLSNELHIFTDEFLCQLAEASGADNASRGGH